MTIKVYIPRDSSAISLGADLVTRAVATEAAKRGAGVDIVRNGSRGAFWLEPLIEVDTWEGRIAYGRRRPPTCSVSSRTISCTVASTTCD